MDLDDVRLSTFDFSNGIYPGLSVNGDQTHRNFLCDECVLTGSSWVGAYFVRSSMAHSDLRKSDMRGGSFTATQNSCRGENIASEVDFRCADLRGFYFSCVDLRGADFRGADLRSAYFDFTQVNLENALFDQFTFLPLDENRFISAGMIKADSSKLSCGTY